MGNKSIEIIILRGATGLKLASKVLRQDDNVGDLCVVFDKSTFKQSGKIQATLMTFPYHGFCPNNFCNNYSIGVIICVWKILYGIHVE